MSEGAESWVTLATNDSYAMGALVLARSLRRVNTTKTITLMITPGVSEAMKTILTDVFDVVTEVNILDSADAAHLALLERPELGITFTKIHCWNLTQFTKCVFLDADTLVLQNCDELFDREELSAAPDAGWPDCFNSGVFVFRPSVDTYNHIHNFAISHGSFDGGDQGLLNMYFNGWSQADASRRLPFIYNMVATASYSYLPAFKVFGKDVKIVHFIGLEKPWLIYYDSTTGLVRPPGGQEHMQSLLQAWWNIFKSEVHPRLSPEMGGGQSQSMVEQVQASFSQIFVSAEPKASQFQFQPPQPTFDHYPPPNTSNPTPESHHNEQHQSQDSSPQHEHQQSYVPPPIEQPPPPPPQPTLLVAIQRYPPDHFWREPPPPPPPIPEYKPPPPPTPSPEHSEPEHFHPSNNPTPTQHDNHHGQSTNAQTSTDGGSGSRQQDHNSSNHDSHHQSNRPREQFIDRPKQPSKEEKQRRKRRSKPKGIAAIYAKMSLEGDKPIEQIEYEDQMRKLAWEQGHIDYMGRDSFDNIMKRMQTSMAQTCVKKPQRKQTPPQQEVKVQPQSPPAATPEPPKPEPTPATQPPPKEPEPTPQPPPKQEPEPTMQLPPKKEPEPTAKPPPKQEPQPTVQSTPKQEPEKPAPKEEVKLQTQAPTSAATEKTPKQQPTATPSTQLPQKEPVPVVEPLIVASKAPTKAAAPTPQQTAQEQEEKKAQEERQALEKKLAEQKKVAEQNLEAEKKAAASRASTTAAKEEPRAPPRKESQTGPGLGKTMPYGMGLGILGAAMVVVFAMYAAYSPTSFFL